MLQSNTKYINVSWKFALNLLSNTVLFFLSQNYFFHLLFDSLLNLETYWSIMLLKTIFQFDFIKSNSLYLPSPSSMSSYISPEIFNKQKSHCIFINFNLKNALPMMFLKLKHLSYQMGNKTYFYIGNTWNESFYNVTHLD